MEKILKKIARQQAALRRARRELDLFFEEEGLLVEDLVGLSTRVKKALEKGGVRTLGDLVFSSEANLVRIPAFGPRFVGEVRKALALYGLALADEEYPRGGSPQLLRKSRTSG